MQKANVFQWIDQNMGPFLQLSDKIFDHPEEGNQEVRACQWLTEQFEIAGFVVEKAPLNIPTAFSATWKNCGGGYRIGILCEYDALPIGHACGHQMQGPVALATAFALQQTKIEIPFTLQVIGTPAEETTSAKLPMAKEGFFDELDVVFMMHGSDRTTVDDKSLALNLMNYTFFGTESHAAVAPEKGRSALDALLLMFNGIEFLREHMRLDSRIHGIVKEGGLAANIVPGRAVGQFYIRAADRTYLNDLVERVEKIARGAALMTETELEIQEVKKYDNKISVPILNQILLQNAAYAGAQDITPPRSFTGSTDFSTVTYRVPGACIRVGFLPLGTSSHSQAWLDMGKSAEIHRALAIGTKALAGTIIDLLEMPEKREQIQKEFWQVKKVSV